MGIAHPFCSKRVFLIAFLLRQEYNLRISSSRGTMAYGKYSFRDKSIRVYCNSNGKEGKWVLQDIIAVLFPTDWESRLPEKIELTRDG